jgi:hypothetical protein
MVNILVLIVPLGSIYVFRLYENELVRQTESELIVQGAFITALYTQAIKPLLHNPTQYGLPLAIEETPIDAKYSAIEPVLDLSHTSLLPQRPDAQQTAVIPDAMAM